MKPMLICVFLILTSLGISSASENIDKEDKTNINNASTALLDKDTQNEGSSLTCLKTRSEKQSIPRRDLPKNNRPGWMDKAWNTLCDVIISLFGWTEFPHNINKNIFNWRSVTMSAVHSTSQGNAKLERWAHNVTTSPSDSWSWFSPVSAATKLWYNCMAAIQWLRSIQIIENACNLMHCYWSNWTNWTWQNTFDVMIISWMTNYCAIALYFTIHFIGKIIRLRRLQYANERERLRELELARERAAQPKPWRPKPKKKRRKKQGEW